MVYKPEALPHRRQRVCGLVDDKACLLGHSAANPAPNARTLKSVLPGLKNGAYWYDLCGTPMRLYTDFETYPGLSFVLIVRMSSSTHGHYVTTALNTGDLVTCNNTAPTRAAKLSDADINYIRYLGKIRWVIVGSSAAFFKWGTESWSSDFGTPSSCSYSNAKIQAVFATPSANPTWQNGSAYTGGCGGIQDASSQWLPLSGIHCNDATYAGGYTGSSASSNGQAAAAYAISGYGPTVWNAPGYVFSQW